MNRPYIELEVSGVGVRRVQSIKGVEALGKLFRYEVDAEVDAPVPDVDAVVGAEAKLVLRDRSGMERVISGVVSEARLDAFDNDRARARLVLRPNLWRQTLGRDCYASQDVTVRDVVDDVLADYTGSYRWDLVRSYPEYPYRVQYREDDWTYVTRLFEEEGIYVWFDHDAGSIAVFSDDSTVAPDVTGLPVLPWVRESAMRPEYDAVTQLSFTSAATTSRFSIKSFDPARPTVPLSASVGSGRHERYDAPGGGSTSPAVVATRASDQLEASRAARSGVSGLATSMRPYPGRVVAIEGHPIARLNDRFLVTRVEVEGDSHLPATTRFDAIHAGTPYRPQRLTPEAKQAGLQLGQVIGADGQEVHPDDQGRVRVILHWDRKGERNEKGGTWMRVAQRGAPGSMLLPRMGWNVATFNEEGGVDSPSLICRIHDGAHLPEYSLPDNMTRVVFKTATTPGDGSANEVHFEDRLGAEMMFMNASRDMTYRVRDAKYETVRNDSKRVVGGVHQLDVAASFDERVIGDQTVTISGNETLDVLGTRSKSVGGNEVETIGGSRTIKVGKTHSISVRGNRSLTVGPAMIELTLGDIGAGAPIMTTLVGGAVVKVAADSITEDAGKVAVQTVGGAKIEIAKKDRTIDVRRNYRETVGGAIVLKTNGKYGETAQQTSSYQVGGPLTAEAPEVLIEATKTVRIKCGDSVLTITEDDITINAKNVDLSGAHMDADSDGNIEHN